MYMLVLFAQDKKGGGVLGGALQGALIGAVVGGLVGLVLYIVRAVGKKNPPKDDDASK